MRPGQLVMLVKGSGEGVPRGTIGEVKDPTEFLSEMKVGTVAVDFPNYPSSGSSKLWYVPRDWLIPINDPDADISDTTGTPVKDFVDELCGAWDN